MALDYFYHYIRDLVTSHGEYDDDHSDIEDTTLDIFGRVLAMRDCRRFMVQTKVREKTGKVTEIDVSKLTFLPFLTFLLTFYFKTHSWYYGIIHL